MAARRAAQDRGRERIWIWGHQCACCAGRSAGGGSRAAWSHRTRPVYTSRPTISLTPLWRASDKPNTTGSPPWSSMGTDPAARCAQRWWPVRASNAWTTPSESRTNTVCLSATIRPSRLLSSLAGTDARHTVPAWPSRSSASAPLRDRTTTLLASTALTSRSSQGETPMSRSVPRTKSRRYTRWSRVRMIQISPSTVRMSRPAGPPSGGQVRTRSLVGTPARACSWIRASGSLEVPAKSGSAS